MCGFWGYGLRVSGSVSFIGLAVMVSVVAFSFVKSIRCFSSEGVLQEVLEGM